MIVRAIRPPSLRFSSDCEITATSDSDSIAGRFSAAGKHVDDAVDGLRRRRGMQRAEHRWPVSAAVNARRIMVSRSRILADQDDVGSSRSAERSVGERPKVSRSPSSRWLIRQLCSCTNSIGSSTVRMWPMMFSLAWFTIAASGGLAGAGRPGNEHQVAEA